MKVYDYQIPPISLRSDLRQKHFYMHTSCCFKRTQIFKYNYYIKSVLPLSAKNIFKRTPKGYVKPNLEFGKKQVIFGMHAVEKFDRPCARSY